MSGELCIGIACYPSLGGSGVIASELAVGLARRGHRVHVLASARPWRLPAGCDRLVFHAVESPSYPLFEHAPYTLAMATAMADVAREHRLDVLHVHYAVPHAASALLARQVLGRDAPALVTTLHGTDVTKLGADPAYRTVTAHAVAVSDAVTVPSDYLRRVAHECLGLPESCAVDVIPNFVDTDHFAPPAQRDRARFAGLFEEPGDGPVLIHVSNFRAVKRPADLVEALALLRRELPARLLLVGDGPERERAERRAAELGVESATCFLGKRHDFAEYLRHADAFVLTSESESFGVAALEAMAAGLPVFAYRVGGLPELVVEGVGELVAPHDVAALADALSRRLSDAAWREAAGAAARDRALSNYRRDPALQSFEDCFRRAIARAESHAC